MRVVGAYTIFSGILMGLAAAGLVLLAFGKEFTLAFLVFVGVSGTTVGIGALVILAARILAVLTAIQNEIAAGSPIFGDRPSGGATPAVRVSNAPQLPPQSSEPASPGPSSSPDSPPADRAFQDRMRRARDRGGM